MWIPSICIVLGLLVVVEARVSPYTICPDADRITPCVCEKQCDGCQAVIVCKNLLTQTTLEEILDKNGDFPFRTAVIKDSSFQYIPHNVFLKNRYIYLTIINCTLVEVLDDDLEGVAPLDTLNLIDLKIQKKLSFRRFANFRKMTVLYVENTEYLKIKKSEMDFLSSKLVVIEFVNTKTLRIESNAFKDFKKLESLRVSKGAVKSIEANMFPDNLLSLTLSGNKLKSIPSDLLESLPNLVNIYLENNLIVSFDEASFGKLPTLQYIKIEGNPIKCDCKTRWIIGRKRPYIEGICTDRKDQKKIRELTNDDFTYCPK
ncbi:uncharacterized protein NPIL_660601 [Nephila pilipes]|uniref:Uncharacterized protein n=1 Tax=Nephila pilipes TaxID=299642 RepID=A0A8X6TS60_NEPPI|nr:uncharacterized protein NPIL_660601 [Nephila pilipes]